MAPLRTCGPHARPVHSTTANGRSVVVLGIAAMGLIASGCTIGNTSTKDFTSSSTAAPSSSSAAPLPPLTGSAANLVLGATAMPPGQSTSMTAREINKTVESLRPQTTNPSRCSTMADPLAAPKVSKASTMVVAGPVSWSDTVIMTPQELSALRDSWTQCAHTQLRFASSRSTVDRTLSDESIAGIPVLAVDTTELSTASPGIAYSRNLYATLRGVTVSTGVTQRSPLDDAVTKDLRKLMHKQLRKIQNT